MKYTPKNIRQIGGKEERTKFYMEDYVSTYLRRVRDAQEELGAAGFLVGSWQQDTEVPCVFVSGAIAISQAGLEGGQLCFSPEAWNEGYRSLGTYFSGQELCGLFVCEGNCRRYRKQALFAAVRECFPDRQAVLYLLTEEGEEIVYRVLPRGEEKLQGYYCYFERNEAMQDYMVDHLPDRRVEWELSPQKARGRSLDTAIASVPKGKEGSLGGAADPAFRVRQRMGRKKDSMVKEVQTGGRGIVALCAVMALMIVFSGMGLVYGKNTGVQMKDILSRLHIDPELLASVSVLPAETGEHYVGREPDSGGETVPGNLSGILVEEIPGNVYPTEAVSSEPETPESVASESEAEGSEASQTETSEPETTESPETVPPETSPSELPAEPKEEETLSVGTGVLYTVKAGDSLYSISRRFYGTEEMAAVIRQLNDLENADLIKVGQELLLP